MLNYQAIQNHEFYKVLEGACHNVGQFVQTNAKNHPRITVGAAVGVLGIIFTGAANLSDGFASVTPEAGRNIDKRFQQVGSSEVRIVNENINFLIFDSPLSQRTSYCTANVGDLFKVPGVLDKTFNQKLYATYKNNITPEVLLLSFQKKDNADPSSCANKLVTVSADVVSQKTKTLNL